MHEHIVHALYYFSVHLLFASIVGASAWVLTTVGRVSASTKYWIWVATAFNFIVPIGALVDGFWASHFRWATPLSVIGEPIWNLTQGRTAVMAAAIWIAGATAMFLRLIYRIRRERDSEITAYVKERKSDGFVADGIPVSFDSAHPTPSVNGFIYPQIYHPRQWPRFLRRRCAWHGEK